MNEFLGELPLVWLLGEHTLLDHSGWIYVHGLQLSEGPHEDGSQLFFASSGVFDLDIQMGSRDEVSQNARHVNLRRLLQLREKRFGLFEGRFVEGADGSELRSWGVALLGVEARRQRKGWGAIVLWGVESGGLSGGAVIGSKVLEAESWGGVFGV